MSTTWAGGSTRAWRQLRAFVLQRDGHRCQVPEPGCPLDSDGSPIVCGAFAATVGHLDPLSKGGPKLAHPSRLRAECARHNFSDGARLGNASRRRRAWSW